MKQSARSIFLAVLIVGAAFGGAISLAGPAAAADDTVSKQFTSGPHKVLVDMSNVTTEITVEVITDESPAGDGTVIARQNVSASYEEVHFRNAGAYDTFTVKVSNTNGSEVPMSKGGITDAYTGSNDLAYFLGDTGGDAGFSYDLSEKVSSITNPQITQLDKRGLPGQTDADISDLDTEDSKVEIYQAAVNSHAAEENNHNTLNNYLQDTQTQALIIGKNAYIRALENGSSESAAKSDARNAIAEYYTVKQVNLVQEWNRQSAQGAYLKSKADTDSNIAKNFAGKTEHRISIQDFNEDVWVRNYDSGGRSLTLANGSTISANTMQLGALNDDGGNYWNTQISLNDAASAQRYEESGTTAYEDGVAVSTVNVAATANDPEAQFMDLAEFESQWTAINDQEASAKSQMDTVVNNTYSEYQEGDINTTDLADPYTLSQSSPSDDLEGWAAGQLSLLGVNSPSNLDQTGSFNISTESGNSYRGVLYSKDNPASGEFAVNSTYNPNDIGGVQYVATANGLHTLESNFTVDAIEDTDGNAIQNVTIEQKQYSTTNVTELQELYDDLAKERAEIEARKDSLQASGGGALFGGSSNLGIVALVGGALLLFYGREQNNGGGY